MKGKNKNQNIKKFTSPQKKNFSNKNNAVEMPAIHPSKLHSQVEFASNIFKLYSGISQGNDIQVDIQREKLNLINNIQNKLNNQINNNKKENIKNQSEFKNNYKNKNQNQKVLNNKIKQINKNINNKNIKKENNNIDNNNEQKEDINLLIAQYNEELDSKNKQGLINNNNNYNNVNIQENINQINNQFISDNSNQNNQLNIETNLDLPQIENKNINPNVNQNIITNNLGNIINSQNQNIVQQNISESPNNKMNNMNNIDLNQNYKYPETNQMIDNIQYLNNNINAQIGNNNISNTPWIQMNISYEEYEKKRIKEENRKKQEEFKKMLDEQRMQKLINKEKKNMEEELKKQKININPQITLPLIVNNSLQSPLRKNIENKVGNEENLKQYKNNEIIDNNVVGNQNQANENDGNSENIIAKRYQDILNNYINEKTKDVELQRNQAINDNNSVEDIDNENNANNKLVVENINNIKRLDKKAKVRIIANAKEKNMRNIEDIQNEYKNKNRTEFNTFRKGLTKKDKNQNMNKNDISNKVSVIDNKNLTGNRMYGKSTNMTKKYKLEEEPRKNDPISAKKEGEKFSQQRAKSFIPKLKLNYKSSETKIKYNIKDKKKSQNHYKKKFDEIENDQEQDPINKLQNIQKFIKGILHDFKDN